MIYEGRTVTTGNSQSMAFEKALFSAHPEFASGRLEAEPISKHYLLVRAVPYTDQSEAEEDPVVGAYLEFLAEQRQAQPHQIQGLVSLERAEALVLDVDVDPDENLGDDLLGESGGLALPPDE